MKIHVDRADKLRVKTRVYIFISTPCMVGWDLGATSFTTLIKYQTCSTEFGNTLSKLIWHILLHIYKKGLSNTI